MMAPQAGTDVSLVEADVVVIGAGPAGIAAAVRAAESGLRVVVVDRGLEVGGQIWRHVGGGHVPRIAQHWMSQLSRSSAHVIRGTSVVDVQSEGGGFDILADSSGHAVRLRAERIVLATGARELLIPFDGWTLPGVMGIGGTQALLKSGASFAGKRIVIAGSGPLMLPVAASLASSGARVKLVAEQARRGSVLRFASGLWRAPALAVQAARYRARFIGASYAMGTWVTAAHGDGRVQSVTITNGRRTWDEPVDVLCTGYGLVPNLEIARLLGCDTRDGAIVVDAQQRTTVANVLAVGEATGIGGAPMSIIEGEIAGLSVSRRSHIPDALLRKRAALESAARRMLDAFTLRDELRQMQSAATIVCRCEDVSYGAVKEAACARQAKLYTRAGMGPCQGRTCMPALEFLFAWPPDTVRPPVEPALVSVLSSEVAESATPSILFNSSVGEAYQ